MTLASLEFFLLNLSVLKRFCDTLWFFVDIHVDCELVMIVPPALLAGLVELLAYFGKF